MTNRCVPLRHIDSATTLALEQAICSAHNHNKSVEIVISSKGGDVDEGLRVVKLIVNSPVMVNAIVVGQAGSMAAVILQCASIRRMELSATLHYHYGSWRVSFLAYFDAEMAERNRKKAVAYQHALILPIVARTGMTEKEVHALLREDRKLSAEEALARGLIDEIV